MSASGFGGVASNVVSMAVTRADCSLMTRKKSLRLAGSITRPWNDSRTSPPSSTSTSTYFTPSPVSVRTGVTLTEIVLPHAPSARASSLATGSPSSSGSVADALLDGPPGAILATTTIETPLVNAWRTSGIVYRDPGPKVSTNSPKVPIGVGRRAAIRHPHHAEDPRGARQHR